MGDDAAVAGAAAVGADPHVGARRPPATPPPLRERVAAAGPAHHHRLRRVDLAVVVEHGADARLAGQAVAVDDAVLRGDRAGAERIGVGVPAVPDPAADRRQPIALAGPGEEGVLHDLELPLERARFLAVRADVAG